MKKNLVNEKITSHKHYATQIIRGAAKARFYRTLRAELADARTAPYRKFGFTLAEVLITLGVIGIVAAMTIPNLVQSYKKREYSTRLKKFYSTMQNVIQLSAVDNGSPSTWDYPTTNNKEDWERFYNEYFASYFRGVTPTFSNGIYPLTLQFPDGSALACRQGGVLIDCRYNVVGDTKFSNHNTQTFDFELSQNGNFHPYTWVEWSDYYKDLVPEGEAPINTDLSKRENVLRGCKLIGFWCTYLLYLDGWEFKDDYPYKL